MRQIKFRALVSFGYLPYEWVYYSPLEVPKEITDAEEIIVKNSEFTGLLDKNGKEIFEGDILRHEWEHEGKMRQTHAKIVWSELMMCWQEIIYSEYGDKKPMVGCLAGPGLMGENKHWDAICGNIYENPELLTLEK